MTVKKPLGRISRRKASLICEPPHVNPSSSDSRLLLNPESEESLEQLEALTGCDEQLQFAAALIDSSDIPQSERVELCSLLDRVQQRRSNPDLYLAVVGEFSSGKSTFINALLRDDLLKTSALVATAAATKLRFGDVLQVEACFKGPQPMILKTKDKSQWTTVSWLPEVKEIDTRQFIHVVTSSDEVAKEVVDLTIEHPATFLASGVVIIDTPGTNAINPQHGAITYQAIEREADAAIIIIPATTPLSQTLVDFLASSLRPFLHRCVFVVTKMDQVRQREQSALIEDIRTRLQAALGIAQPTIFVAAPQIIIDDLTEEEEIPGHLLHWKDKFLELETTLQQRLRRERTLNLAESVLRLLTRLLKQLEGHLQVQWGQYETRQATIKSETIQDLSSFAAEQHRICRRMIEEAIAQTTVRINICIVNHQETTLSNICDAIFNANDESELNSVVQTKAEPLLESSQRSFQMDFQREFKNLSQAAQEAEHYFDRKFSEAYCRLQALAKDLRTTADAKGSSVQFNTSEILAAMQSHNSELDNNDGNTVLTGGATGAAIGSIILPVIGTVIGGVVGAFLSIFFMPSLDERKQKLWTQLSPNLDAYFDAANAQAQEVAQTYAQSVTAALEQRIDAYITRYKAVVDAMLSEQTAELQRLTNLQASTQANLSEIDRRKKALSAQQQRLEVITVQAR